MSTIYNDSLVNPNAFNVLGESQLPLDDLDYEPDMAKIEQLPDGSFLFGDHENEGEQEEVVDFYENLAEVLEESKLSSISSQILEGIDQDRQSRQEWDQANIKGMKYLGFKLEESKDVPFMSACRAFDTTFSTALLRFHATVKPELFPDEGPADTKLRGHPNDLFQQKADNIKDGLNYLLTEEDRDYYPDKDRMLMYIGLLGCCFTKVYQDPITNQPVSRFIDPKDFLINNDCVSILSSNRLTHDESLTRKEIKLRQATGFYRDIDLPEIDDDDDNGQGIQTKKIIDRLTGINLESYDKRSLYHVYESHVDLDDFDDKSIKKQGIPKPYIVSICKTSKKILSVRRNWREEDPTFKRIEYFVQYNFVPGFGIYGLGLTQLIGSNAVVLTSILRQLIDKGTLSNFPGGLIKSGLRIEQNDKPIGPGEFRRIETDMAIQQSVMALPYGEPSVGLANLRNELIQQTQTLTNTIETAIAEGNPNAPVGTTLALLEVNSKVQSSIFSSLRKSLGDELNLIYNLFKRNVIENPFSFKSPGKNVTLTQEDFIDEIIVIPNSDPKLTTSAQRILYAEGKIRMAMQAPQLHNMREVFKGFYSSIGMNDQEIDQILPAPQQATPLDPITENMNAITGKPLAVAAWQDHPSHRMTHSILINDPNTAPDVKANIVAHDREHEAQQYLIDMQMTMGIMMPNPEMLMNPEVQNEIAILAAQATQQKLEEQQQQMAAQQPLDPNQVMMADITQRRDQTESNERIAEMKTEQEIFKTQMDFEKEKMKVEVNREISEEKNEKDILLAQMKSD